MKILINFLIQNGSLKGPKKGLRQMLDPPLWTPCHMAGIYSRHYGIGVNALWDADSDQNGLKGLKSFTFNFHNSHKSLKGARWC